MHVYIKSQVSIQAYQGVAVVKHNSEHEPITYFDIRKPVPDLNIHNS